MTGEASARSGQHMVAGRIRQLLEERGLSKRGFARLLHEQAPGGKDFASWERQVYMWTSDRNPVAVEGPNLSLVASLLGIDEDELRLRAAPQAGELLEAFHRTLALQEEAAREIEELRRLLLSRGVLPEDDPPPR